MPPVSNFAAPTAGTTNPLPPDLLQGPSVDALMRDDAVAMPQLPPSAGALSPKAKATVPPALGRTATPAVKPSNKAADLRGTLGVGLQVQSVVSPVTNTSTVTTQGSLTFSQPVDKATTVKATITVADQQGIVGGKPKTSTTVTGALDVTSKLDAQNTVTAGVKIGNESGQQGGKPLDKTTVGVSAGFQHKEKLGDNTLTVGVATGGQLTFTEGATAGPAYSAFITPSAGLSLPLAGKDDPTQISVFGQFSGKLSVAAKDGATPATLRFDPTLTAGIKAEFDFDAKRPGAELTLTGTASATLPMILDGPAPVLGTGVADPSVVLGLTADYKITPNMSLTGTASVDVLSNSTNLMGGIKFEF
jgi:hypothetical protein